MPKIEIRNVAPGDAEKIAEIYRPAVSDGLSSFELSPPDTSEMGKRMNAIIEGSCPFLVAVKNGVVVGYAYANVFRARPAYRYCVEDSVYVAQGEHGNGVGTALLGQLIEGCELRKFRQMIAVITGADSEASIALHHRHGFKPAGTLAAVGFKQGQWLDTIYMQRALGPGAGSPPA